jgi:glyoxylase-like metal-dependent hydrolase (beta-lactamase superfamily II)
MSLAIADRWFEWRTVGDGVVAIWEPHVRQFYRCNIWLVRGRDRDLLIDTGLGVRPLRAAIAELLERPVLALATHTHFDHIGGHHEFADRLAHAAEADIMARPTRANTLIERYVSDEMLTAVPDADYRPGTYRIAPAPATRLVAEGDRVDLGDRSFEVLHLPGHSPGSIGLWEEGTRVLFSGDAIYDGQLVDDNLDSDVAAYVRTMERLRGMPVRVVHGGHCPSFGRERLVELVDGYLRSRRAA